jgi:ubiquinone/menaquinone biosynthesis C-methylase UbiE
LSHQLLKKHSQLYKGSAFSQPVSRRIELLAKRFGRLSLDLGCGNGTYLKTLAKSGETVGIDFLKNNLYKAKDKEHHLVLCDAHFLPFKDNTFSLIITCGSMEHFFSVTTVSREMHRILRHNGISFVHIPIYPMYHLVEFRKGTFPNILHKWRKGVQWWIQLFNHAGFNMKYEIDEYLMRGRLEKWLKPPHWYQKLTAHRLYLTLSRKDRHQTQRKNHNRLTKPIIQQIRTPRKRPTTLK